MNFCVCFEEEMVMAANFRPTFGGMQVHLTLPVDLYIFSIQVIFVPCMSVMCADRRCRITIFGLQPGGFDKKLVNTNSAGYLLVMLI